VFRLSLTSSNWKYVRIQKKRVVHPIEDYVGNEIPKVILRGLQVYVLSTSKLLPKGRAASHTTA
jgi:hypothetical protein